MELSSTQRAADDLDGALPFGLARAEVKIGLMNLTYNILRYIQLTKRRRGASAVA
jgi:hypothetical protein